MPLRGHPAASRGRYTARVQSAFTKVEGLGNDFMLVEATADDLPRLQARAPSLCDRRLGIGGDGILVVGPPTSPAAHASMWVVNHDGSRPEMCGNGLRCVALWVAAREAERTVVIDTDDGAKRCTVTSGPDALTRAVGMRAEVEVDMGAARHGTAVTPESAAGRTFSRVSMGNPHAVAFVGPGEDPEALARQHGPAVETDPDFPEGTNVEFAAVDPDGTITLWVWERGCGITDACGTGACATAAAAVAAGLLPAGAAARVQLPGGPLTITVPDDGGGVLMCGPARFVFRGELPADNEATD